MARKSSGRSGGRKSGEDGETATPTPPSEVETGPVDPQAGPETVRPATDAGTREISPGEVSADADDADLGGDTVLVGDGSLGDDTVAPEPRPEERVTLEPGDTTALGRDDADPARTEALDSLQPADPGPAAAPPPPERIVERVVERRGPGMGALVIGGAVAAALGFGAAYLALPRGADTSALDAALAEARATLSAQSEALEGLQAQVATLAAAEPPALPEVDLSGLEAALDAQAAQIAARGDEIAALDDALGEALADLGPRVAALEERPIFSGDLSADSAAMAEALDALETRLAEERSVTAAAQAEAQAAAAEAQDAARAAQEAAAAEVAAAAAAAQAAIAEAEARARETAEATRAQAAMAGLRIAMASGDPFAEALAALDAEIPAALAEAAQTGVPTLGELQASFPAAARAALPVALQETAGESMGDRVGAFLLGQLGGRSVEPREGDDPDAILSRAEAATAAGDLETALAEIAALPQAAQDAMGAWVADARTRAAADAALADLAATLAN